MSKKDTELKAEMAKIDQAVSEIDKNISESKQKTEVLSKKRKELEGELSTNTEKRQKMDSLDKKHDRLLDEFYKMQSELKAREETLDQIKKELCEYYGNKCKYTGHSFRVDYGYGEKICMKCRYEERI